MKHYAQCHCGNITASFDTKHSFETLGVRECACTFCQKHKALYVTDPKGTLSIDSRNADNMSRYSFATKTIEFILCKTCGVCVAAVFPDGEKYYGVLNVRTLNDKALQLPEARLMDYDEENKEERVMRRRTYWTPLNTQILDKVI